MKILTIARDPSVPRGLSQEAFKYLYLVTKVRTVLIIVNYFSLHNVEKCLLL